MVSTIAFTLMLVAIVVLLIIPSFKKIRSINEQVLEERKRLELLYTRGQVQKTYGNVKEDAEFLNNILLKENQELQYITAIEELASLAGIEITMNIGDAKRIPEQRISELEFSFLISGTWEQILGWIEMVETLPHYTNINEMNVAIHSKENNPYDRTATVSIGATTYWLIPIL